MTSRTPRRSNLPLFYRLLALIALSFASHASLAQVPAQAAAYQPTMTFDVASVRESKEIDPVTGFTMSGRFLPGTTHLSVLNWRIDSLLSYAFGLNEYQIAGVPNWPPETMFVIEARGDGEADAKSATLTPAQRLAEQRHMLQLLLEDRFQLKVHWETRPGAIYNLVLVPRGSKLGVAGSLPPSAKEIENFGTHPIPELYQRNDGNGYDFIAHTCSIGTLTDTLAAQFSRPVSDKTALTGRYDFVLRYKGRWDRDRPADDPDPLPPLDRALQEQLGLKLEPAKGPINVLVVDHIAKPSEN